MSAVDWIIVAALVFSAVLAVSSIVYHRKLGELCECKGDCSSCTIRCMSNERYYGSATQGMAAMPAGLRRAKIVESRLSRGLRRVREMLDVASYWFFNLCGIAYVVLLIVRTIQRLLG